MYVIYKKTYTIFGGKMKITVLLKEIRKKRGISLDELALMTGISKSHLNYIEKNEKDPSLTISIRITKALNIDIKDFYKIEE